MIFMGVLLCLIICILFIGYCVVFSSFIRCLWIIGVVIGLVFSCILYVVFEVVLLIGMWLIVFMSGCSRVLLVMIRVVSSIFLVSMLVLVQQFIVVEYYNVVVVLSLCMFMFFFMIMFVLRKLMLDMMQEIIWIVLVELVMCMFRLMKVVVLMVISILVCSLVVCWWYWCLVLIRVFSMNVVIRLIIVFRNGQSEKVLMKCMGLVLVLQQFQYLWFVRVLQQFGEQCVIGGVVVG